MPLEERPPNLSGLAAPALSLRAHIFFLIRENGEILLSPHAQMSQKSVTVFTQLPVFVQQYPSCVCVCGCGGVPARTDIIERYHCLCLSRAYDLMGADKVAT